LNMDMGSAGTGKFTNSYDFFGQVFVAQPM
jgi:hypothetical protein